MKQLSLFNDLGKWPPHHRNYLGVLTVSVNRKGVLDVDTVKGCERGLVAYPDGGCYGECYAYKNARTYGFDFGVSVNRQFMGREHKGTIIKEMNRYDTAWYRVGTFAVSLSWNLPRLSRSVRRRYRRYIKHGKGESK